MSGPALATTKVSRSGQDASSEQLEGESTEGDRRSGGSGGDSQSGSTDGDKFKAFRHDEEDEEIEAKEDDDGGDSNGSGGSDSGSGGSDSESSNGHDQGVRGDDDSDSSNGHGDDVKDETVDRDDDHGVRPDRRQRRKVVVRVRPRRVKRIPVRVLPRPPTAPRASGPRVRAATLPFTGPAETVQRYAMLALLLMMCGVSLVALGSVDRGLYRRRFGHR
jgi:hypothetical protein